MKKIMAITFFMICMFFLVGCKSKNTSTETKIKTSPYIEIGEKQYIKQLKPVKIKGTNDTLMITKKVKFKLPEHKEGETVSFSIAIPYKFIINGKDYEGTYQLNSSSSTQESIEDYVLIITDLTKKGDIEVMVIKK